MVVKQNAKPKNVLVVCHGNICRSALAGALLKAEGINVRTRAMSDRPLVDGQRSPKKVRTFLPPDCKAAKLLEEHRSQRIAQVDVEWADVILYMDNANLRRLALFPGATAKAKCLGSWVGAPKIADPNFMRVHSEELKQTLQLLSDSCLAFTQWLKTQQGSLEPAGTGQVAQ